MVLNPKLQVLSLQKVKLAYDVCNPSSQLASKRKQKCLIFILLLLNTLATLRKKSVLCLSKAWSKMVNFKYF